MKILKAVVCWSTYAPVALIDLVFGLLYAPIIFPFLVIHQFTNKVKIVVNLIIEIRFWVSWLLLMILVPTYAWYYDLTIRETYFYLSKWRDERKYSLLKEEKVL